MTAACCQPCEGDSVRGTGKVDGVMAKQEGHAHYTFHPHQKISGKDTQKSILRKTRSASCSEPLHFVKSDLKHKICQGAGSRTDIGKNLRACKEDRRRKQKVISEYLASV